MSLIKNILVIAEFDDQGVKPLAYELIHAARLLADSFNGQVHVFCFGFGNPDKAKQLFNYGADRVQVLNNPLYSAISLDLGLMAIEPQIIKDKPYAVFFPATTHGKEFAASLSAKFNVGLATDCVAVQAGGDNQIIVRRPVYAGKALSNLTLNGSGPHILSLRQNTFRGPGPDFSRVGNIELLDINISNDQRVLKIREVVKEMGSQLDWNIYASHYQPRVG